MNRYLERVENVSRFLEVHLHLTLDMPPGVQEQWQPLLASLGDTDIFTTWHSTFTRDTVVPFLLVEKHNPNSILSCLSKARENARSVRERISTELWEQLNDLYLYVKAVRHQTEWPLEELFLFLEHIKLGCYCIAGMAYHTLSRTEDWHLSKLGRHLERADQLTRILDLRYDPTLVKGKSTATTLHLMQWGSILRSMSGYEMYRRECGVLSPQKIAAFLILNPAFPRSLRFNVIRLQSALHALTRQPIGSFKLSVEKLVGQLRSELDYTEDMDMFSIGLHRYLDNTQDRLFHIGNALNDYFSGQPKHPL
jgi:uncharacterized alpha-E superfamily protein